MPAHGFAAFAKASSLASMHGYEYAIFLSSEHSIELITGPVRTSGLYLYVVKVSMSFRVGTN